MAAGAKVGIKVLSVVIGIPVGIVTKKVIERAWLTARPADPPRKPSDRDAHWVDAIGWGVLSAAGIVIADLVTRQGAEAAYKAITGNPPPPQNPGKGAKKLTKASEKSKVTAD